MARSHNGKWSYEMLHAALGNSDSSVIANNTRAERFRGGISVILHATAIAILRPDGTVRLRSGGWHTATTKDRMNRCLPPGCGISQEKSDWFFDRWDGPVGRSRQPYSEGMVIDVENRSVLPSV